ncbi:helix-turn-helix transcriptional regulator [Paraflavitalea pollutisoli]|uniref:helix-turn-helix transcriptional regulator n=1 Tax=Paraflavitalea pollutisoli TaxID=3034143 RepID=UPI0023EA87EA|nr:helix-turn-helix transcriptional regulator [Paraflavitalea sp. H1-2-19X]
MEAFFPTEPLQPFVHRYLLIESREGMVNRLLPDTSLVLSIRLQGKVSLAAHDTIVDLPTFTLSGLRKTNRIANYGEYTANLLVVFRVGAATAFFKEPLHGLFEAHVPLDQLEGHSGLHLLEEQLGEAVHTTDRVALVERYLLQQLLGTKSDPLILESIRRIQAKQGQVKIRELAGSLYISQDAFEKRFRRLAGVTPKQFAFITKMRAIVLRAQQQDSLADMAFDAGYYDLPHFNKDFKLFTGQTPTAFQQQPIIM